MRIMEALTLISKHEEHIAAWEVFQRTIDDALSGDARKTIEVTRGHVANVVKSSALLEVKEEVQTHIDEHKKIIKEMTSCQVSE